MLNLGKLQGPDTYQAPGRACAVLPRAAPPRLARWTQEDRLLPAMQRRYLERAREKLNTGTNMRVRETLFSVWRNDIQDLEH